MLKSAQQIRRAGPGHGPEPCSPPHPAESGGASAALLPGGAADLKTDIQEIGTMKRYATRLLAMLMAVMMVLTACGKDSGDPGIATVSAMTAKG